MYVKTDKGLVNIGSKPSQYHKHEGGKWVICMDKVRSVRDQLLADCDYAVLPDSPLKDNLHVLAYRQALRDLPEHVDTTVEMPELPDVLK